MISSFVNFIQTVLLPLGAWGVFFATIIEEVIAPIPSAAVVLTAGFLLPAHVGWSPAFFSDVFFIVVLPSALGVSIGSLFVYGLAYASGKPVIDRWGKWLGVSWQDIDTARNKFTSTYKDELTVLFLRAIPLVPSVAISALCGIMRMNVWKYLLVTFIGSFIRAFILALIGAQVGELYFTYAAHIDRLEKIILWFIVGAISLFILYRFTKRK
ncbi:MAG: VTT domain-containing protein [Patescibacteria group bacterium]|nr:VTT domain-containing protein [bacterium]MDZ4240610.1 VTT domain-containing protein [Patescibacteria group bacterium]